jgi:alpha-D-xyloside xylohydrolase
MPGSLAVAAFVAVGAAPKFQQVLPGVWRVRFGTPEKLTPLSYRSAPAAKDGLAALPKEGQPLTGISFRRTARGIAIELPLAGDEKIYGLGLNTRSFDLNGRRSWVVPSDNPEAETNESHAPEPFYVSTKGYGVYVDTARFAAFSVGSVDRAGDPEAKKGDGKVATSTSELYGKRPEGRGAVLVDVPSAPGVDVYVFAGPTALQAVQRYILFSGGGAVPPLWGLGMAYRAKGDFSADQALALARSFRRDDIPCDIFGVEPGWQTQTYSCSFLWNPGRFPDPDGFIRSMHAEGYRLSFWEHPFTHPTSPIYAALKPFSGDYRVWNGLVPDFATSEGRRIFLELQERSLFSKGVDSVKIDELDHQPFKPDPWSFPEASQFPSGLDGETMHSLIGALSAQTMNEPFRAKNLRTWGLIRQEGALSAPLPYVVYSDSYDLKSYVRGMAKSGFGGHLWTPEVRDAKSVEDLIRRTQAVVFSPYAMVNCWYMGIPPWRQIDRDKANAGVEMPEADATTKLVRDLFRLRMSLVPYLYSAFNEYRTTGLPPTRALVLDYPDDPETRGIDDQFMLGRSLMVAPIISGTKRSVYLPAGEWFDFFTGEKLAGGRRIEVEKGLDSLPLYVKSGSTLPLAEPMAHVGKGSTFVLKVRTYGANPAPFTLYEDDGETLDFEKGAQNRVTLEPGGTVRREGNWKGERYRVEAWERIGP